MYTVPYGLQGKQYKVQAVQVASSPSSTYNLEGMHLNKNDTKIDQAIDVIANIQKQKRLPSMQQQHSIILQNMAISADRFELNEAPIIESDDEDNMDPNLPRGQSYIMTPGPIVDASFVDDDASSSSEEGIVAGTTLERDKKYDYLSASQIEHIELQKEQRKKAKQSFIGDVGDHNDLDYNETVGFKDADYLSDEDEDVDDYVDVDELMAEDAMTKGALNENADDKFRQNVMDNVMIQEVLMDDIVQEMGTKEDEGQVLPFSYDEGLNDDGILLEDVIDDNMKKYMVTPK